MVKKRKKTKKLKKKKKKIDQAEFDKKFMEDPEQEDKLAK